jgi:hypothetical protein
MRIRGKHIRAIMAGLCAVIFVPVAGQFFVSLADENGWYQHPGARVAAMIAGITWIMAQTWFPWTAGGVGGLTIGVWLDAAMRAWDRPRYDKRNIPNRLIRPRQGRATDSAHWLGEAAQIAYGNLGPCRLRDAIDRVGKDNEGILHVVARLIGQRADIYGARNPSHLVSKVDRKDIDRLFFHNQASYLAETEDPLSREIWSGLIIEDEDLDRAISIILGARDFPNLQV